MRWHNKYNNIHVEHVEVSCLLVSVEDDYGTLAEKACSEDHQFTTKGEVCFYFPFLHTSKTSSEDAGD